MTIPFSARVAPWSVYSIRAHSSPVAEKTLILGSYTAPAFVATLSIPSFRITGLEASLEVSRFFFVKVFPHSG